jgi:D-3-phosphoglycerate dehydrogenase
MKRGHVIDVVIAGDEYMEPVLIEGLIKEGLGSDLHGRFQFRGIKFPYPVDTIPLQDDTVIPSGMSWTDFTETYKGDGAEEFYGNIHALEGELGTAEVLVVHGAAVTGTVLREALNLKLIGVLRGGPKNIDIKTARSLGIRLVNTPGKTSRGVAESTIGGILSLTRNIARSNRELQGGGIWSPAYYRYRECGIELEGKVLGIIGFGHIAEKIAKMLGGFDLGSLLVYDPFRGPEEIRATGAGPATLLEILQKSDIISLHARLTESSRGIIGKKEFEAMGKKPIIVNTARGGLIDYPELIRALETGRVGGAVLDVFGDEPFGFYKELLKMKNVVCTPHIAGGSRETVHRAARMIAEELCRYALGEPFVNEM